MKRIPDRYRGEWALVTGASSGIGREFCVQLAAAGMNVALTARRKELLDELAATLSGRTGVQTMTVRADLGDAGAVNEIHRQVAAEGIRVRILVNNAGVWHWGLFEGQSADECARMIHVNALAVVQMVRAFLPDLGTHPDSVIVNVSSPAALQPMPYAALYAATKAFVHSFSRALREECGGRGIRVKTLVPGATRTNFASRTGGAHPFGERLASPSEVVKKALEELDGKRGVICHARWTYLQRLCAGLLPADLLARMVGYRYRWPEPVREAAR
jgi:short-subunit dehydrogenase